MKRAVIVFCVLCVCLHFCAAEDNSGSRVFAASRNTKSNKTEKPQKLKMGLPPSFSKTQSKKFPAGMGKMSDDTRMDFLLAYVQSFRDNMNFAVDKMKTDYPDLHPAAEKNFQTFEKQFAPSLEVIAKTLKHKNRTVNDPANKKPNTKTINLDEIFEYKKPELKTREDAEKTCKTLADAAKGELPKSILPVLYRCDPQCALNPEAEMEMFKGATEFEEFEGKGRIRIRMSLDHPASWVRVDKKDRMFSDVEFRQPYDKFFIMLLPIITNASADLRDIKNNSLWNSPKGSLLLDLFAKNLPNSTLIKKGKCNINSRMWGWVQLSLKLPRDNEKYTTECFMFCTFCDERVVIMAFIYAVDKSKGVNIRQVQDFTGPLCRKIIQTVKVCPAVLNKEE